MTNFDANRDLRQILDILPVGVRILSLDDFSLLYSNEACLKVFGCTSFEEQVQGQSGFNFMPERQPDGRLTAEVMDEVTEKGDAISQIQCLKLNGEPFTCRITSCTIIYEGHNASLAVMEDVTEEEQYRKMLESIAAKEREANLLKSDFLSHMSHEIRTPLSAVIGMASIGIKAADLERKHYALSKIEDASNHLLGIINDVLDLSKIEANKFELSKSEFVFVEMVERAVGIVAFRIKERNQLFTQSIDKAIPHILISDDQRLAQVITNLVSNAVKFTPENGSIRLSADLVGMDDGEYTVRVSVTDTGIGISEEQQKRIFSSYLQGGAETTRKFGGTGLGLAISKNIAEMLGGCIELHSEVGKGSTFSFTFKAERGSGETVLGEKTETEKPREGDNFSGHKILLAEDVEINREIIASLVEDTLLEIDYAGDGAEAVAMFEGSHDGYGLIFMDIQMPELDGYEATRMIRASSHAKAKTVPIIAMTANVFREDIDKCLAAGMNGHISKPIVVDEFFALLRKYLPGRG